MNRLERSYRRLMLAYPADYRRRHAAEIVTTLVDMSPPERRRPPLADIGHLLAAGVRQRFRLPARRPTARVAAALVTVVLGAFGAAAGSWVAARTYADLPSRAGFSAVSRLVSTGTGRTEQRDATPHAVTSWWSDTDDPGWAPSAARARLTATGWAVTRIRVTPGGQSSAGGGPGTLTAFDATRDGLHLRVLGNVTAGHRLATVLMWPQGSAWRWPLTVAGAVIGLLGGWAFAARLAYRLHRAQLGQAPLGQAQLGQAPLGRARLAAALLGTAVATWLVPAAACYANLGLMVRAAGDPDAPVTVHSAFTAGPFETWGWPWMILQLSVAGLLLGCCGILALRRRSGPGVNGVAGFVRRVAVAHLE